MESTRQNINIRPLCDSDLENLVRYADNPKIWANLSDFFPHPYTKADGLKFLKECKSQNPANRMAITLDDELIGLIGFHPQQDIFKINAEFGYWIAEPYWGRGIMTEALKQMIVYSFENFDVLRIFARTFGRNIASQRTLEKAGFTFEAKFEKTLIKDGVVEDELIYAVRRDSNR